MKYILIGLTVLISTLGYSQDTTIVQTLTFDSTGRVYNFTFPDGSEEYRKIVMEYKMRCKNGLISNGQNPNQGCGEWDYSCNTFITDSTRIDSVKAVHPDHIISGFNGSVYDYTSQPTYTYYEYDQVNTVNTGVISEIIDDIGTGSSVLVNPFMTTQNVAKSQYLVLASELVNITSGNITGITMDLNALGADANFLRIRLKNTLKTSLNDSLNIDLSGFTDVYFQNTTFPVMGGQQFDFNSPFVWDGTSNIIVEVSYTNSMSGAATSVMGSDALNDVTLISNAEDEYVDIPAGDNYGELANPINFGTTQDFSIEMWVKPGQTQNDPSILSDKNWGSGSNKGFVVFQNGSTWRVNIGDGSNRVDITGGNIADDGEWHHIAVTFDRDGMMTLYQDGALVASTSITSIGDVFSGNTVKIGQDGTGSYGIDWVGNIDDLRIWNTALSAQEVENWMHRVDVSSHPAISDLLVLNSFNNVSGSVSFDESINGNDVSLTSAISNKRFRGKDLFKDFSVTTMRPNIQLIQGTYSSSVNTTVVVMDSIQNPANVVTEYGVSNNDLVTVGTNSYFEAGDMPIIDESGNIVGYVNVPSQGTITITDLDYFQKYPAKIEIMSFVTPYGLGLDMGVEGEMWVFDMTDFTTVLRGDKRMSVEFSGAYQEELDIRFLFIKGTPPRDVIDLQQVWRPGVRRSYTALMNEDYFEPRDVLLQPSASMFKLRTAITGHGQEGEFIPRTHYMNVNGGTREVEWQVWKECADNPIFPQGGTWIYDRAGWCPGAATDVKIYEIDPSLITGNSINLDYGVTAGSGTSEYYVSYQMVSFGDFNFQNDASIIDLKRPTQKVERLRFNPSCANPVITIQNTGAQTINSIEVSFNVAGGALETYTWTGNIESLKTVEIELPVSGTNFWIGNGTFVFEATIVSVNGSADDYSDNNTVSSPYELPDYQNENFIVELRTNNNSHENSYEIRDYNGSIVHSMSGFADNTTYRDTLDLPNGCYTLQLFDTGEDGLDFWANSSQGTGYFRIKKLNGVAIKTFEPDFGREVSYGFTIGTILNTPELSNDDLNINVYPNPASNVIFIQVNELRSNDVEVRLYDLQGRLVLSEEYSTVNNSSLSTSVNVTDLNSGQYLMEIEVNDAKLVKNVVIN